jgi:HTH-type transcriptional regulator/antitoxin HigA
MANNNYPAEVFHPGEFIREELDARGWTQDDLAAIIGRPIQVVNLIINGKKEITPRTALELAAAFGSSAEIWMNLQSAYDLSLENVACANIKDKANLYQIAPVKIMQTRGWIRKVKTLPELQKELCEFYETNDLTSLPQLHIAARASAISTPEIIASQLTWGFRVRKLAKSLHVSTFSKDKVMAKLGDLLKLAAYPEEIRKVPRVLADMGIRFVIVEHLPKTRMDGAALSLDGSPVIGMSLRYDRIDNFWHVVIHELSHILHGENMLDVDVKDVSISDEAIEARANQDAAEMLIPRPKLDSFIARVGPLYSADRINRFAKVVGVHPGIVLGQLQNRKEIGWEHFREMLIPIREIIIQEALTDGWGKTVN